MKENPKLGRREGRRRHQNNGTYHVFDAAKTQTGSRKNCEKPESLSCLNGNKKKDAHRKQNGTIIMLDVTKIRRPRTAREREKLVRRLNSEISKLGENRHLGQAVQVFRRLIDLGLDPTIVSYTALLNAYVRACETGKALEIFHSIVEPSSNRICWYTAKKSLRPNIVTYTTMIKGLCNDGQLVRAWEILWNLLRSLCLPPRVDGRNSGKEKIPNDDDTITWGIQSIIPNVRCMNTYLRGCVRTGDVLSAWVLFKLCRVIQEHQASKGLNIQLIDGISGSLLIKLLAHAQKLNRALDVIKYFESLGGTVEKSLEITAGMRFSKEMKHGSYVKKAETTPNPEIGPLAAVMQSKNPLTEISSNTACFPKKDLIEDICFFLPIDAFIDLSLSFALRGKRKRALEFLEKAKSMLVNQPSQKTDHRFSQHRANEHRRLIDSLQCFLSSKRAKENLTLNRYRKLFFFPPKGSTVSPDILKNTIVELQPVISFPTNELLDECDTYVDGSDRKRHVPAFQGLQNLGISRFEWKDCIPVLRKTMHNNQLNFKSIFTENPNGSIKLEICSGAGDWIISQCLKEQTQVHSANWVALELRHDRVFNVSFQVLYFFYYY